MDVGELHFTYGNAVIFAVGVFLLAGVYSFVKQGLKIAAVLVFVLAAAVLTGGVLWL